MSWFVSLFYKPYNKQLTVTSSNGFHLRPIAQFSALANSFECEIRLSHHNQSVDAKAVNTLLSLSLDKGDTFTLHTQGKRAKEAQEALVTLFETLMHNDVQIEPIEKQPSHYEAIAIEGESIAGGIAIAPPFFYNRQESSRQKSHTQKSNMQESHTQKSFTPNTIRFHEAVTKSTQELETLARQEQNPQTSAIYLAQKELLASLQTQVDNLDDFQTLIKRESLALVDTKLASKNVDYDDILARVKRHLGIFMEITFPQDPFILIADNLLPSEIAHLEKTQLQGVILQKGSRYSHTAILLRSAGIVSMVASLEKKQPQKRVLLDSSAGVVILAPTNADIEKAQTKQQAFKRRQRTEATKRFELALTKEGKTIALYANVSDVASAQDAKEQGAEGIGLLRSEFLFKQEPPTLQKQVDAYRDIFALFEEVTVRTLDVGGDKALPYISIASENNPFLGVRGVRLFQTHLEIIQEQLKAIFIASQGKPIKIMFPMVNRPQEFIEAKKVALEVAKVENIDISHISFGIMIEVPSVLFLLEAFNEVVDFYSIGSNDLMQYLFAIERTHPTLKIEDDSGVIFSIIAMIVQKVTKPLSICGELASDPKAIKPLIESGITTLSVSPHAIAQTKAYIRNI